MQEDPDDYILNSDFSIKDLKQNLEQTNASLLDSLKERYMKELLGSMIFFVFNEFCKKIDSRSSEFEEAEGERFAKKFFDSWKKNTLKRTKKEILEINNKLKIDEQMQFLGAISNFSLPSTEDYQFIYDKAMVEVQKIFIKNTENN